MSMDTGHPLSRGRNVSTRRKKKKKKKKKDSHEWAVKISKSPLLAPPASE